MIPFAPFADDLDSFTGEDYGTTGTISKRSVPKVPESAPSGVLTAMDGMDSRSSVPVSVPIDQLTLPGVPLVVTKVPESLPSGALTATDGTESRLSVPVIGTID